MKIVDITEQEGGTLPLIPTNIVSKGSGARFFANEGGVTEFKEFSVHILHKVVGPMESMCRHVQDIMPAGDKDSIVSGILPVVIEAWSSEGQAHSMTCMQCMVEAVDAVNRNLAALMNDIQMNAKTTDNTLDKTLDQAIEKAEERFSKYKERGGKIDPKT